MSNPLMSVCPYLDPGNTRVAVYEKGREITYGELARGISHLSANILKTGVTPGSRIGLCFDNNVAFIYGYLAARRASCIPVLLSPGLPAEKLTYVLGDSGASGLLSDARTFRKVVSNSAGVQFAFLNDVDECSSSGPVALYSFGDGIGEMNMSIEGMGAKEKDADIAAVKHSRDRLHHLYLGDDEQTKRGHAHRNEPVAGRVGDR